MDNKITVERISIVPPVTMVYWSDKTKTEAVCSDNPFDEQTGILICVCKKFLGSYGELEKIIEIGKEESRKRFEDSIAKRKNT